VARLLTLPALEAEIAQVFAAGGRIAFNLAPPILAGRPVNGRPRKREFGAWLKPMLRVLAQGRHVRGTAWDLFGYTAERRSERALIEEYERLVDRVLGALTPANHAAGVRLLSLAEEIRGFGPVKEAAIQMFHQRVKLLEQDFLAMEAHSRQSQPDISPVPTSAPVS
jgi:indolepyruvate ferredoxin oxidoreductase